MPKIDLTPSEQWARAKLANVEALYARQKGEFEAAKAEAAKYLEQMQDALTSFANKVDEERSELVSAIFKAHGQRHIDENEFGESPEFSDDGKSLVW